MRTKSVFICLALVCNAVLLVISKIRIGQLMQVLQTTRKIEDEERKFALLEILSDKYSRTILDGTLHKPKSAMDIAADANIPISTVYRRLQTLHDNKLMAISGMISDDGKKFFLYKSKVKGILTKYDDGKIEVSIVPNLTEQG